MRYPPLFHTFIIICFTGTTRLGLTKICVLFQGQPAEKEKCEALKMPSYWAVTLVFIVIGICLICLTVLLLLLSIWRSQSERLARIIGFLARKYRKFTFLNKMWNKFYFTNSAESMK